MLTIGIFPPRRVIRRLFFHIKNFSQKKNELFLLINDDVDAFEDETVFSQSRKLKSNPYKM